MDAIHYNQAAILPHLAVDHLYKALSPRSELFGPPRYSNTKSA